MKRIKSNALLLLIFIVWGVFNYNPQLLFKTSYHHWGWHFSLIATVFIIFLMKVRDPNDWKQKLGIDFTFKDILSFVLTAILLVVVSFFVVSFVTSRYSDYSFQPQLLHYQTYFGSDFPFAAVLSNYIYYIPETFNEEMLIGAFLLFGIQRKTSLPPSVIAALVAFVFSFMHQALYKWSPVQPGTLLTTGTIFTLFSVGVLRNVLILKTGKIVYSWAVHLSFNLIFFAGFYVHNVNQSFASEPEKFNIVFGNPLMVFFCGSLALLSLLWLNSRNFRINKQRLHH
jgi:hypothetical protein